MTDITVQDEGSIVLLHLNTEEAKAWVAENVSDERTMFGDALAVERRFAVPVLEGMEAGGLTLGA